MRGGLADGRGVGSGVVVSAQAGAWPGDRGLEVPDKSVDALLRTLLLRTLAARDRGPCQEGEPPICPTWPCRDRGTGFTRCASAVSDRGWRCRPSRARAFDATTVKEPGRTGAPRAAFRRGVTSSSRRARDGAPRPRATLCSNRLLAGLHHVVSAGGMSPCANTGALSLRDGAPFDLLAHVTVKRRQRMAVGDGIAVPGRVCAIAIKLAQRKLAGEIARYAWRQRGRSSHPPRTGLQGFSSWGRERQGVALRQTPGGAVGGKADPSASAVSPWGYSLEALPAAQRLA